MSVRKCIAIVVGGWLINATVAAAQVDGSVGLGGAFGQQSASAWTVDGAIHTRPIGAWRLTLAGNYQAGSATSERNGNALAALSTRLGDRGGVWAGATRSFALRGSSPSLEPTVGGWRMVGRAVLSLTAQRHQFEIPGLPSTLVERVFTDSIFTDTAGWRHYEVRDSVGSPGTPSHRRRWSDVEARADWTRGRIDMTAQIVGRIGDSLSRAVFGTATAAIGLVGRTALVLRVGSAPRPFGSSGSAAFASVGLRIVPRGVRQPLPAAVRPSATVFSAQDVGAGTYRIAIRVPRARTVEVSGDFTGWKAVTLRETTSEVWEATLPISSGTHRVNIRVDGDRWTAPPGLPSVADEFNGRVGLLVVR